MILKLGVFLAEAVFLPPGGGIDWGAVALAVLAGAAIGVAQAAATDGLG